jgi:hypothetical protein
VIGGQHEHAGVGVVTLEVKRHDRDRGCRVTTDRFQDLNLGLHSDFPHLLRDEKPVLVVRNDDRGTGAADALEPQHRVLKQGSFGNKRQELLRQKSPRHGPQAAARSARENYGIERDCHSRSLAFR